jgi:hypothetical protein
MTHHTAPARPSPPRGRIVSARVWLDLPPNGGTGALRGALMSMGFIPQPLPLEPAARRHALASLADGALAFIDVSWPSTHAWRRLDRLWQAVPDAASRQRITLSRLDGGHVSPQDRDWVTGLGFADLLPEWTDGHGPAVLHGVLTRALTQVGSPPPDPAELLPYSRPLADDEPVVAARALVRGLTGASPEAFVALLGSMLDVHGRHWGLTDYPRCFVGAAAVEALMPLLHCSRDEVVALGQALAELGLLVHVAHEHPFLDRHLYYRLAWSASVDALDAGEVWRTLEAQLPALTDTHHYLGTAYPVCFVGEQAVTLLTQRFAIDRVDAWLALHRMAQWGFVEHVTQARPFIDGHYFYRWTAADDGGSANP